MSVSEYRSFDAPSRNSKSEALNTKFRLKVENFHKAKQNNLSFEHLNLGFMNFLPYGILLYIPRGKGFRILILVL